MNPIAFTIFGLEVRWYGIIITFGLVMSAVIAARNVKNSGMDSELISDYLLFAVPIAIICARLYYVAFEWDYYAGDILRIINIRQGGLAIHGGLIGGFLSAYIFSRIKKIDFFQFLDIICVSIPLGQSIGRWGNFTNSEAHGVPTALPWAINVDGVMVHPTFLYESIWDFLLFLLLMHMFKNKKHKNGQIVCLYLVGYSVGRFFIEGLRTDSLMIMGMRTAQLMSLFLIAVGLTGYFVLQKKSEGKSEIQS